MMVTTRDSDEINLNFFRLPHSLASIVFQLLGGYVNIVDKTGAQNETPRRKQTLCNLNIAFPRNPKRIEPRAGFFIKLPVPEFLAIAMPAFGSFAL